MWKNGSIRLVQDKHYAAKLEANDSAAVSGVIIETKSDQTCGTTGRSAGAQT